MKKLIATLVLVVTILIAGVVVAQTYNTLHGTVNLTVTAQDPLYFVGLDTWDLTLAPGERQDIIVQIANRSQSDVTVLVYAPDPPLGVYLDVAEWLLPAGVTTTFPLVLGVEYPAEGDYILDLVFEPL